MKPLSADVVLPGTINGTGSAVLIDATTDNVLVTFRFANPTVLMQAAEEDFDAAGHHFHAGTFLVPDGAANPAIAESIKKLGLTAYAGRSSQRKNSRAYRPAHRLRPLLAAHAGRGLGSPRARSLRRALHLLRRSETQRGPPPGEVRRHRLPFHRRFIHVAGQRHSQDRR